MPIQVTEKFTVKRFSKEPPWTAYREFDVTGVGTSESAALSAIDAVDATKKVPQANDGHPDNPTRLKCRGPKVASRPGPQHFCIGTNYAIPATGNYTDNPPDPLLKPVEVDWEQVELSENVDVDLDSRGIVYSNGEPVSGGLPRPIVFHRITLIKNFPFINPSWLSFSNTTNKTAISFVGGPTAAVQQARLACVLPASRYSVGATYYPIKAVLEVIFDGALGSYPFQHRVMDQGTYGFSSDNKGVFVGADGNPVSNPIKLDGTGLPMNVDGNSLIKVKKADGSLVAPVASPGAGWTIAGGSGTDGSVYVKSTSTYATIGWFKKTRIAEIGSILTLFN